MEYFGNVEDVCDGHGVLTVRRAEWREVDVKKFYPRQKKITLWIAAAFSEVNLIMQ